MERGACPLCLGIAKECVQSQVTKAVVAGQQRIELNFAVIRCKRQTRCCDDTLRAASFVWWVPTKASDP
jgi:hypothetical protein